MTLDWRIKGRAAGRPATGEGPWWIGIGSITMDVVENANYILFGLIDSYSGPIIVTALGSTEQRWILATGSGEAVFTAEAEQSLMLHQPGGVVIGP